MFGPTKTLDAATAVGIGTKVNAVAPVSKIALQVVHQGASTCVVTLKGSLDGSNLFVLTTWTLSPQTNGDILFVDGKPCTMFWASLDTISGAGATVSAWICGV